MDFVFSLKPDDRSNFLRGVVHALRCVYICLWSYIPHPANYLVSMDGWFNEEDAQQPGSSSSATPRQQLFDAYQRSFCRVETGCVPGLAYKEGASYLELEEPKLMSLAATPSQRQFYQEAGIKTAVFMGCRSGEIELGTTAASNINMQMGIRNMFSEDFIQQSLLGDFSLPDQSRPSSSSSSLMSRSMGSPEYSSLILSKASASYMRPDTTLMEALTEAQAAHAAAASVPPHQLTMQAYGRARCIQFPNPTGDDAAMTRAMLAVISSSSSSSSMCPSPQRVAQQMDRASRRRGAFKPYSSALAPRVEPPRHRSHSQRMIKMAVTILRQISTMHAHAQSIQETRPTSNQLHHMISERKRREKINESFDALRMLLPPGTKKDKASVLARTKEYVNALKAQISDLEEKNRLMEARLVPADEAAEEDGDSGERVRIQIFRPPESSSQLQQIELRVTVSVECDVVDLVLPILGCLKEMGDVSLVSLEANGYSRQMNPIRQANLTIKIEGDGWDEGAFKEAIRRAVGEAVAPPAATAAP